MPKCRRLTVASENCMKSAPSNDAGCLRPPTAPRSVTRKDFSFQSESVGPKHCFVPQTQCRWKRFQKYSDGQACPKTETPSFCFLSSIQISNMQLRTAIDLSVSQKETWATCAHRLNLCLRTMSKGGCRCSLSGVVPSPASPIHLQLFALSSSLPLQSPVFFILSLLYFLYIHDGNLQFPFIFLFPHPL